MSVETMGTTPKKGDSELRFMRARYRAHCSEEVERFRRDKTADRKRTDRERAKDESDDGDVDHDFYLSD